MTFYCKFIVPILLFVFWILPAQALHASRLSRLSKLNIERGRISISGVSSGAFMAVQMHVAHSELFSGVGVVAGGPYACANNDSQTAISICMQNPKAIETNKLVELTKNLAAENKIDSVANLHKSKVFIFHSPSDQTVLLDSATKLIDYYQEFLPALQIKALLNFSSSHGFPTLAYGANCKTGKDPWLLHCNFDLAHEILLNIEKIKNPRSAQLESQLLRFNQGDLPHPEFLFPHGWIYIPKSCQQGQPCGLHIALHGCKMNPNYIQDQFVKNAGYNEWAESNQLVILYPQSAQFFANPYGCWDWYGATGSNYLQQSAAQMQAIRALIQQVSGF